MTNRIPFDTDADMRRAIDAESLGRVPTLHEGLTELISHSDYDDEVIERVIDWAIQIRERMELPFDESFALAMIFYFG